MRLEICCQDRVGLGQKVLSILAEYEINLRGIELKEPSIIYVNIIDLDFAELQEILPKIRLLEGVEDVKTAPFMPSELERKEFATLIKSFPDPFISIDMKGNIRLVNNIASSIIGKKLEEIEGQPVSQWG